MGRNLPRRLGNPVPANEADEALLAKQRDMLLAARAKRTAPHARRPRAGRLERPGHRRHRPRRHGVRKARMDPGRHQGLRRDRQALGDGDRLSHIKGSAGFADDYADMARAALQLWEVTGDERFLDQAKAWTKVLDEHFWNSQINGYCFYADDAEQLFVRPRMLFDNPAPSANGTMLIVLTRLALLTGEHRLYGPRLDLGRHLRQ